MNAKLNNLMNNLNTVIVGKEDKVKLLVTAFLGQGHILIEDIPGCGKTTLAKALAKSINADFSRIQFTPDLLPADVTGLTIYNTKTQEFELKKGPVFTDILLADEINRATPRTQSALLECMEEKQVTIDGTTNALSDNFFVIATENPIETAGTFPLPEAQLDRFAMRIEIGYPSKEAEKRLLSERDKVDPLDTIQPVLSLSDISEMQGEVKNVYVHPVILDYVTDITDASRNHGGLLTGVSPRGALSLINMAKAYAYIEGRDYVIPDDIQSLAASCFAHRVISAKGYTSFKESDALLKEIVDSVQVPTEDFRN